MPSALIAPVRLVPALGAVWLLAITLMSPSATRIDVWPWAAIASAGWITLAVAALGGALSHRLGGWRDAGLLAFALVITASAWNSSWSGGSLASILPVLGATALLYFLTGAFAGATWSGPLRVAIHVVALLVVTASLIAWLVGAAGAETWVAGLSQRNAFPFGHWNHTGGAALLALSWLAARAVAGQGMARAPWLAATATAALVVVSSGSRAAVAALAGGTGLFLVSWWWRRGRRLRDAAIAILVLAGLLAAGVGTNERLRDLALHGGWSAISIKSNNQRLAMAEAGSALGWEHGLLGPGPGTVPLAYGAGEARLPGAPDGALQLHSTPLQVWATTGPAGLLALLLLLTVLLPVVLRALTPLAPSSHAVLASGLIGYGVFSLSDHQFDVPFVLVMTLAHVAVLAAPRAREFRRLTPLRQTALVAAGFALLAGPLVFRARDLAARHAFARAIEAHDAGDSRQARDQLDLATAHAPWDRYYREAAAAWSWDSERHIAAVKLRAVLAEPTPWPSEFATYNLAWIELTEGVPEAAGQFRRAARLAPHRAGVHLGLGLVLAATGDREGAVQALARECLSDPVSVTQATWDEPGLRALWPLVSVEIAALANRLAPALTDDDQRRRLRHTAQLVRWWRDPASVSAKDLLADADAATAARLRAILSAPAAGGGGWSGEEHWGVLAQAWAEGRAPEGMEPEWSEALARRLETSPDFVAFVTGGVSEVPVWRHGYRVGRGGYRTVMRHPDSPILYDFPVFEDNLLVRPYLAGLFPVRGWLPGRAWAAENTNGIAP